MRSALCATLIPVATVACAIGHAGPSDRRFSEKVQTPIQHTLEASRSLVVEYLDGSITVEGTSGGHVVVTGTRTDHASSAAKLAEAAQEVKVLAEAKDGAARIVVDGPWKRTHPRHRDRWGQDYRVVTDLQVKVPAEAEVTLTAVNGGTMVVRNVRGTLKVTNVNGSIQTEGLAGAAKLTTVNGSIEASYAQPPAAPTTLTTVNGNVKLKAPASFSADLKLSTIHGEMVTNFPFTYTDGKSDDDKPFKIPGFARKIRIGQGGPAFTCTTVNGDLVLQH